MESNKGISLAWSPGTLVLLSLVAIFCGAFVSIILNPGPGILAVVVGLLVVGLSVLGTAARPHLAQWFGIKDATTEISLMRSMFAVTLTGLALILLGFLNLMHIVPWWKP